MRICTYCGKKYKDDATICAIDAQPLVLEGGQQLAAVERVEPLPRPVDLASAVRAAARRRMMAGGACCALGLIVTLVSFSAASGREGSYLVAWGAVVFGAFRFFTGLVALNASTPAPDSVSPIQTNSSGPLTGAAVDESREVCLVWKCPRCDAERDFLTELDLAFGLTKADVMLHLRCAACCYALRVDPAEKPLLNEAEVVTRLFKSGRISHEAYAKMIRELPARFVNELISMNDTWPCPKCGQSNPVTFDSCWSCHDGRAHKSSGLSREVRPEGLRGGNPWD